ncbi:MAG: hypothetical protein K2M81_02190, partial [Lachnospiraceae bacterium]|nr:hypothetical protein [Lachnospiraceae bacterium]
KASALSEVFSSLVPATLFTERERGDVGLFILSERPVSQYVKSNSISLQMIKGNVNELTLF